ncbi:MAG: type II secretion system F family protein [Phycisphaerales bacterium]|nr:type II secretion system F family protein [Phycisphaerales bacterium]
MPTYQYEALDATGKPQRGALEASSSEEAIQQIRGQGFFPTSVREQQARGKAMATTDGGGKKKKGFLSLDFSFGKKKKEAGEKKGGRKKGFSLAIGGVNKKNLTLFTRQLSTLQDAGLPLLRSIQILEQQQKAGKLKTVLGDVSDDVESGTSLSESMAKHPKAFDRLYSKMVNAGEIGGVLDIILQRLANFMEKSQRLRRRIKGAMIYPIVVILIAVVIVTGIMVFVIPKFEEIFNDFNTELPELTRWLIDASNWMAGKGEDIPGFIYIVAAPFVLFFVLKIFRRTNVGRAATDWTLLHIPVIASLVEKTTVARFTRTLGTLISAGVPILEAINITRDTCGNWVFERALTRVHDSIREGETFAEPLREAKVCDSLVVNMIDVGEETGDMDVMLMKIADNYDEEVDVAVQSLLSLLEPLLVVCLGGAVGVIVISLFLPLVKLITNVSDTANS